MMRVFTIAVLALTLGSDAYGKGFMSGFMPGEFGGAPLPIVCPAGKLDLSLAAVGTTAGCNIPLFIMKTFAW
jgi:hypothetical protein